MTRHGFWMFSAAAALLANAQTNVHDSRPAVLPGPESQAKMEGRA
jgi:hypothetical protein